MTITLTTCSSCNIGYKCTNAATNKQAYLVVAVIFAVAVTVAVAVIAVTVVEIFSEYATQVKIQILVLHTHRDLLNFHS